jgi:hypothetical protein
MRTKTKTKTNKNKNKKISPSLSVWACLPIDVWCKRPVIDLN